MKISLKIIIAIAVCSGGFLFSPPPVDENPGSRPTVLEWDPYDSDDDENPSLPVAQLPANPEVPSSAPWTALTWPPLPIEAE